jgi:hypothetical protein
MTFDEYVDQEFCRNLELAREELAFESFENDSERDAWNHAREWTLNDIEAKVASYIEKKWWNRQEYINKAFYE